MSPLKNLSALVLCIGAPLLVGAVSGMSAAEGIGAWYQSIAKPSFTPPDAAFGPVWTALYIAMGVAAYLVWRSGVDSDAVRVSLAWFGAQLIANGAWSIIFFGQRNPAAAFVEILLLIALILITIWRFRTHSRVAALLMVPYLAWVVFAAALNFSIWRLNA